METVMLNSTWGTTHANPLLRFHSHGSVPKTSLTWKKRKTVRCTGNAGTSNGLASVLKESKMGYHNKGPAEAGSLVFAPNGESQEEIGARESTPYNGTATSTMEYLNEGIGILNFLKGKRILITGATGFIGKVLIEKILRTAPDVGEIFVLIKAQSRNAAMNRVKEEIINTELFKCLRELHGESYEAFVLSKLVPVVGNLRETNLGIEPRMLDEIAGKVDVIVNSAANTTFDERYDIALDINTKGPWRLMNFAKSCGKLKLFLHVSTAYVNGQRRGRVMEKAFRMGDTIARETATSLQSSSPDSLPVLDVESEIKLAQDFHTCSSDDQSIEVSEKMKAEGLQRSRLHGWQDTYAFTKAMGEMLINHTRGEVPVVIIRPSVVESTCKDPFPGWIEGNRMMDPVVLLYGKGQLTGFLADPIGVLDVIPADMVVNATLAAMAKHGAGGRPGISIYHLASSVKNPLLFQDLMRHFFEHFNCYPYIDPKGRPIRVPEIKLFHSMDDFASHVCTDARAAMATSRSSKEISRRLEKVLGKLIEQTKHLANIYKPYTFYGGRFDNTNMEKLMEAMSEEEKRRFDLDVGKIDWQDYITNVHIPGLRRHVMKGRGTPGCHPQH